MNVNLKNIGIAVIVIAFAIVGFFVIHAVLNSERELKDANGVWVPVRKDVKYKLHRLDINNEWFLKDLEKIVFSEDIPSLREEKYKVFSINACQDNDDVFFSTELLYRVSERDIGYFELNGYLFFVRGDLNPDNIFVRTKDTRKFLGRKYISGPPPPPEEFPLWYIKYENGRLYLMEKYIW